MMGSILCSHIVKKVVLVQVIALCLALSFRTVTAESLDNHSTIESLIAEAVQNNPELKSFQRRIEAFEQRPSQARSLDDPMVKLAVANLPVDSFRFDQEAMTQKQVQVMQKFPFPGTLDLKGNIAEKDLAVTRTEFDEKKNSLIRQVKTLYNNLLFLDRAIAISGDNRDLLAEVITTAETQYAAGRGGQQEIIKARMELSGIIQKVLVLRQQRESAAALLNTLLNRPVQNNLQIAGELHPTALAFTLDELQIIAEETRPALKGLKQRIEQARLAIDLAEKEYYPGMEVGLGYGQRDDSETAERPDFFSASVSFNIPLWYRNKESRKVAEKRADQMRAEEQYATVKNSIHFRLKELLSRIEMNRKEIELFERGFIPQSTVSFESAMSGYRVNKVDFLTLIRNQIALYNYKIEHYRAIADHENSLAELEETAGRRLF
jgi:outer membrane protein TolC